MFLFLLKHEIIVFCGLHKYYMCNIATIPSLYKVMRRSAIITECQSPHNAEIEASEIIFFSIHVYLITVVLLGSVIVHIASLTN